MCTICVNFINDRVRWKKSGVGFWVYVFTGPQHPQQEYNNIVLVVVFGIINSWVKLITYLTQAHCCGFAFSPEKENFWQREKKKTKVGSNQWHLVKFVQDAHSTVNSQAKPLN